MSEQSTIPVEWRTAAEEAAKALSVARAIERRQYPDGDAPSELVAALVLAVSIHRGGAAIAGSLMGCSGDDD